MSTRTEERKARAIEALGPLAATLTTEYSASLLLNQHDALLVFLGPLRSTFYVLQGSFHMSPSDRAELHAPIAAWQSEFVPRFPEVVRASINTLANISATWITDHGIRTCNTADIAIWNSDHWTRLEEYEAILRRALVKVTTQDEGRGGPAAVDPTAPAAGEDHEILVAPHARIGATSRDVTVEAEKPRSVFKREGQFWSIEFEGQVGRLKDTKGLQDIAALLSRPGEDIAAIVLVRPDLTGAPESDFAEDNNSGSGSVSVAPSMEARDEMADETAMADVYRELQRIRQRRTEAEALAPPDAAAIRRCNEETAQLEQWLDQVRGLSGRARPFADAEERARKAVSYRIRAARRTIEEHLPALAQHLALFLKTGRTCRYRPDPPVRWDL